jgi:hypothetical protein
MEPRIAELLVRGGLVSKEQLTQAQEKERDGSSSVIKELVRLGFTTEDKLTDFLAKQFGIEKIDLDPGEIEDSIFSLVPPQLIQKHQLIPVKLVGSNLTVAMADPTDLVAINEVKFITGYGVRVVAAFPSAIKKTLEHRFGGVSYDVFTADGTGWRNATLADCLPSGGAGGLADVTEEAGYGWSFFRDTARSRTRRALLPVFAASVTGLRWFGRPPSLCLPYFNLLFQKL